MAPLPGPLRIVGTLTGLNRHGQLVGSVHLDGAANPADPVYEHGIISVWDPSHATTRDGSSLGVTALRQQVSTAGERPGVCASLAQSLVPRKGRMRALALVCGER